jgi:hypothetical protein
VKGGQSRKRKHQPGRNEANGTIAVVDGKPRRDCQWHCDKIVFDEYGDHE